VTVNGYEPILQGSTDTLVLDDGQYAGDAQWTIGGPGVTRVAPYIGGVDTETIDYTNIGTLDLLIGGGVDGLGDLAHKSIDISPDTQNLDEIASTVNIIAGQPALKLPLDLHIYDQKDGSAENWTVTPSSPASTSRWTGSLQRGRAMSRSTPATAMITSSLCPEWWSGEAALTCTTLCCRARACRSTAAPGPTP
jgi:hypothetical protein